MWAPPGKRLAPHPGKDGADDAPEATGLLTLLVLAAPGRRWRIARVHFEPELVETVPGERPVEREREVVMHPDTARYNEALEPEARAIGDLLAGEIDRSLPEAENKIWHAHPVWFLEGNPVVGYSKLKGCVRLLFWSGRSFEESGLKDEGSFKAAEARYTDVEQIDTDTLRRWLAKARDIQWDYRNLVRRKGRLERLK